MTKRYFLPILLVVSSCALCIDKKVDRQSPAIRPSVLNSLHPETHVLQKEYIVVVTNKTEVNLKEHSHWAKEEERLKQKLERLNKSRYSKIVYYYLINPKG